MVYASEYGNVEQESAGFGWTRANGQFDWGRLIANKDRELARLNGIYERLLVNAGVDIVRGHGRLVDPHSVDIDGRLVTAKHILLCPGGWPSVPNVPGSEHAVTSNEIFSLAAQPKRLLIVGGGYIATEFAGVFNGLGTEVVQIYRGPLFMRGFDDDIRQHLAQEMRKRGVDLRFESDLERITEVAGRKRVRFSNGIDEDFDCVFFATGRHPRTANLGLEALGIRTDERGAISVNEHFQTNVPSIYAVGDVIDRIALTPVALAEGMLLAKRLFGGGEAALSYDNVASAVFSQPNVGTVGLSEVEARARVGEVKIFVSSFRPMKHTMTGKDEKAFLKMIVSAQDERVLGLHMVGPDAGEVIQGFSVALNCGAKKSHFDMTIGIHPTLAEEFVTMRTPRG